MEESIQEQVALTWNKTSSDYDEQYAHGIKSKEEKEEWLALLGEQVGPGRKKILDVGTGTGFLALLLAELGHDCKGIDLSEGMMEKARGKAASACLKVQFTMGDAENLTSEADGTYDIVTNRHLLWTLPHPDQAVSEWLRVLKPGGKLIIIDGDWFHATMHQKASVFLGRVIQAFIEKKNPWKKDEFYNERLVEKLPMMRPENAREVDAIIKRSALTDIKLCGADKIEAAELAAMPLYVRLLNPYHRIIISGVKR